RCSPDSCFSVVLCPFFPYRLVGPPRSTLFPYTTLFRSGPTAQGARKVERIGARSVSRSIRLRLGRLPEHAGRLARAKANRTTHADRKSTRLNSSHVAISYAVFCLKKKKKMIAHAGETLR